MIKNKSFIKQFVIQNGISAIIIFIIFVTVYTLQEYLLDRSFPTIYDLLEYEDKLVNDEFEKIPLSKFKDFIILIYDENDKTIYVTDKEISNELKGSDLEYVSEIFKSDASIVYKCIKKERKQQYYISKIKYENETETLLDDAILSYNLDVIGGTLFGEKEKITKTEFDLMNGIYKDKYCVNKYLYETANGAKRSLLVLYPEFTIENYNKVTERINKTFWLAIPLILIVTLINTILTKRSLRKSIETLEIIIKDYENDKQIQTNYEKLPIEFKTTANKFKQLFEKLEVSKLEKNRIIANITHDLKTPMTAIMGYIQAFKDNIVPEDKKKQYVEAIYDRASRSADLVNRLAEYTKLEHPEYKMKLEEVNINEFTKQYIELKVDEINTKGFMLKTEISQEELKCNIDKELIIRLYENLLSNILNHNPKGTKILFKIESMQEKIKITIADNGVGIGKEVRERIFEPFIIGNEARTSGEGTGLGMAIVNRIVKSHNGEIKINENLEKGYVTQFNIFFEGLKK